MIRKVNEAREFFGIDEFPGNLFEKITSKEDYIEQYNLLLFKDDLDKLSGFISYIDKYAYIGINHKRPIGHQNFTLAHEIGHLFLKHLHPHFTTDNEIYLNSEESVASQFAIELLYPEKCFLEDFSFAMQNKLFDIINIVKLAKYIDQLCHKYFLSYKVVFNRFYYKYYKKNVAFLIKINIKMKKKNFYSC